MATTYTYTFPALEAYPQHEGETDVVFTIHWRLDGTDETNVAGVYGSVSVSYSAGETFTPFSELTESKVQEWVEESLGEEQVAALKANIDAQLAELANPSKVTLTPPWVQTAEQPVAA